MTRFLRSFEFNRLSFWLGFLAGTLLWWLLGFLRPLAARLLVSLRERSQLSRLGAAAVTEIRLLNDILRHAQGMHLASPLFSLDEIAVAPRLLAPPALTEPGILPPPQDITEHILPYLPDAPEPASFYAAPTLSLMEALQGSTHLIIIGNAGYGKTVALAHLASQIAKGENLPAHIKNKIPLLVHAADIPLPLENPENLLGPLVSAITRGCPSVPAARLESFLPALLSHDRILLLLDGLDELPPADVSTQVAYIGDLLQKFPSMRVVATATPDFYDGLAALGFVPVSLASWDQTQRYEFITRWSELWIAHIGPLTKGAEAVDPILLNAWLTSDKTYLSPLDLTLKVWAVYAGDASGSSITDWIEAYLRRMIAEVPKGRPALEILARQALLAKKPVFSQREAQSWLAEIEPPLAVEPAPDETPQISEPVWPPPVQMQKPASQAKEPIRDSRVLPALVENGLLLSRQDGKMTFQQPFLFSYLAGCDLAEKGWAEKAWEEDAWGSSLQALGFLAAKREDAVSLLRPSIEAAMEPLMRETFVTARSLRYAPENVAWRGPLMRQLARILQNENYPMGLRARALSALALSGTTGVDALFRQSLTSPDSIVRQLAALGSGMLRDAKAVNDLKTLLNDSLPNIRRAACLALAATGNQLALEALADAMLHGDEELRQFAAEALANNLEEGHPTLKEGATIDDLLVRRATVFGLRRIRQSWVNLTLQQMQVSEEQWLVKDAATQVLDEMSKPDPHIPRSLPDLTETPWLIAFAGERGIGIAPGKPALELLLLALKEGKEEQRLAALEYLARYGDASATPLISQIYMSSQGEIREAAYNTLWHNAAAGFRIPIPV